MYKIKFCFGLPSLKEHCTEIIKFAKDSCADDRDDGYVAPRCPLLSTLSGVNLRNSDPLLQLQCLFHILNSDETVLCEKWSCKTNPKSVQLYVFLVGHATLGSWCCKSNGTSQYVLPSQNQLCSEWPIEGFGLAASISVSGNPCPHEWLVPHLGWIQKYGGSKTHFDDILGLLPEFFPHHELWNDIDAGRKQASQCIPLYLHGDEGTTYKRQGVLIVSWQSPLGYGSSRRPHHMAVNLADMGEAGLPLNFLKSGTFTRMLTIITPKDWV